MSTEINPEPVAWMDPTAGCVMDAFLWQKDPSNPQYSVPVYASPAKASAAPAEVMRDALLNIRDYRQDVADEVAAPSMRLYASLALDEVASAAPGQARAVVLEEVAQAIELQPCSRDDHQTILRCAQVARSLAASPEPATAAVLVAQGGPLATNGDPVGDFNHWMARRGPLGAGACPDRAFIAGHAYGRRAAQASQPVEQPADDARDAARYRFLRDPKITEDFPPADGACWVVQYGRTAGSIPELKSAGFGAKLDATIDLAMQASKGATDGAAGGAE